MYMYDSIVSKNNNLFQFSIQKIKIKLPCFKYIWPDIIQQMP